MFQLDESVSETGEALSFEQKAHLPSFLGLSLKNGLLNLVTLTLYRFWGKTEVRRRVWASTYMNGEPFEYTGRGVELFIGFLLALAVLGLPFLVIVFGAQFLGPLGGLLILAMYLAMPVLIGFGIFSAARYMASRTTWRGVRFQLRGKALDYGFAYLGQSFLTGLTFGWWAPAMARNMAERLWSGLRFGDRRFGFDSRTEDVGIYGPYALAWFGMIVLYGVWIAVLLSLGTFTPSPDGPSEPGVRQIATIYASMLVLAPAFVLVYAPYQAALLRSIAAGVHLEGARFKLDVKALGVGWLTLTNIVLLVVSLGLLAPYVQARTVKYMIGRLSSTGTADLAAAQQAGRGPKSGEGLADAFGFAPI